MSETRRRYWSERQGRGPAAQPLDFERLKTLVFTVLDDLLRRDFFVEAFGYQCVDAGEVDGRLGPAIDAWFLRELGRDSVWPYTSYGSSYDEDTLFDVLEALHDLVASPVDGWHHDFASCGMHWQAFDRVAGQRELRALLNPLLERYERPLEFDASGEITAKIPDELRTLLDAAVPTGADEHLVTARVQAAVALYRGRSATG